MQLADQSILTSLRASGRLPSPTGVALTILELTRNANTSTEDMAEVLHGDPALAGKLIKYANSVESGSRTEIKSLNEALVRLGTSTVRQLCLGFSVISNARRGPCCRFDYQRYWTHSLATAVSCQSLARRIPSISPESAFTCGLLAGIGRLALASVYPDEYATIMDTWKGGREQDLSALEQAHLSIDHNQVTAALFEDWRLPESYRYAVVHQDDDWRDALGQSGAKDRGSALAGLLNVAAHAAKICLETGPERHLLVMEFMRIGSKLAIPEPAWIAMYDEILSEWARMGKVLDVVTSKVPSLADLVRRAREHRQPIAERDAQPRPIVGAGASDATEGDDPDQGLAILVVSGDEADARSLEAKLTSLGHHVTVAGDGHQALELALQSSPELVITDSQLPGMDGLELCQTLRRSELTRRTFVVIMTNSGDTDELIAAFDAGVNDYVTRPLNFRILAARLRAAAFVIRLQEKADRDHERLQRTLADWGKLTRKLEHMALEDQLTGLPNRRAGLRQLDMEWARARRDGRPLLVMLLDIDHFKRVNDTYGHDAGDIVLRQTAQVLNHTMRKSDSVCRFGGEEFLVICPGAGLAVASELGDRIRCTIEANRIETPGFQGSVTVSVGVAEYGSRHPSPKDLIKEADEALYAAKEAGRNKVCIATPD